MKTFHSFMALPFCAAIILLCTACDLLAPIFSPKKEFVFPLSVGNKWIYDYSLRYRTGTETWEITQKETNSEGTKFRLHIFGEGIEEFPQNKAYTYTQDTTLFFSNKYYIVPLLVVIPNDADTLQRYSDKSIDTLKLEAGASSSSLIHKRYYVHNVGLVYYEYSGSRLGGSLKLRSYSLK